MRIGVLALQGAFAEHISVIERIGAEAQPIRLPDQMDNLDGLVIPGGESTTMLALMSSFDLVRAVRDKAQAGLPTMGTCAGMVCMAREVSGLGMETLALMDIEVERNSFGRQADSFEDRVSIPVLGDNPFPAVFIRAPSVSRVGPRVDVLATLRDGTVVGCRQGKLIAIAFHPELTGDVRLHKYFLSMVMG